MERSRMDVITANHSFHWNGSAKLLHGLNMRGFRMYSILLDRITTMEDSVLVLCTQRRK
jgi:hypothetical protein